MADNIQTDQGKYNTISSQTLQPQPAMAVPPTKADSTPYQSIIDGALTSLPSVTTQVASAQKNSDNLLTQITSNMGDLANKGVYSQNQQDLQGVKQKQQELDALDAQFNDLGAQIKGLSRASQAVPLQVQENALGTGATDAGVAPQTAGDLRKNAIQALTLASQADVLGAQITNTEARVQRAKDNAQQAVDLKYKPLEAQQAQMKELLDLNQKYILDPAEKKRVEATRIALDERTRLLQEEKQNEKDNTDLVINANSQGAPASLIQNVKNMIAKGAKPMDIANALGVYAGDYIGTQLKLKQMKNADLDYKIKNAEFIKSTAPALGQASDGTVIKGTGANATDRNTNTVEQLIRQNGKAIPDGLQTQITTAQGVINSLKELVTSNPKGEFVGMFPGAGALDYITPNALKRDATVKNEGLINAINLKVQQWASGASLTEAQTKKVEEMVPKKGDTDNVVREKIKTLTDMMNTQISADFTSAGVKFRPEKSDYFDDNVATKVKNAVGAGYSPTDIVNSYLQDPAMADKIKQAKALNYTDEQIVTKLQTLQ